MQLVTFIKNHFLAVKTEMEPKQQKDTGLLISLFCLVMAIFSNADFWIMPALISVLITLLLPTLFYPVALIWFLFARLLSALSSTIILTILFVLMVIPMGLLRKALKKDSLQLKAFKKSKKSMFMHRDYTFKSEDLLHPF